MKLTPEQRAELKALAAYWQSSHPILCKGTLALLADLEEAEAAIGAANRRAEGAELLAQEHCVVLDAKDLELAEAQAKLEEAAEDIEGWGSYASQYFQEKHDLAGVVAGYRNLDTTALSAAIEAAVEPYRKDAERWRNLKPYYTAAVFDPEREDGLDLGKGVALVFMLPEGARVSANPDATIDAIRARQNKEATEI